MSMCEHCDHAGHLGVYRGIVTNDADPEGLYRVKALVPQVLGEQESAWAWPVLTPLPTSGDQLGLAGTGGEGESPTAPYPSAVLLAVPTAGEGIWIMFEGGDTSKPLWLGTWRKP